MRRLLSAIPPAVLAGLLSLLVALPVSARDVLEVVPTFSLIGNYDDNIRFFPVDPIRDFYAQISPGLNLRLNFPVFPVEAEYAYTRYQYLQETRFNQDFHQLSVLVPHGIRIGRNLTIKIQDRFELVPVDMTRPENQPDNLIQRNTFTVGPVWEGSLARKLKLAAGYEFLRVDYTSRDFRGDDYFGHRFFAHFNYHLNRHLNLFQRNTYRMKNFSRADDYSEFTPEAGVELGLGQRLSFSAAGGYSFEESGDERYDGYVYTVGGKWAATARLDLEAKLRRLRTVDVIAQPYTERFYELTARYRPAKKLALESSVRYYDYTIRDRDFQRIGLRGGFSYRLNRWSSISCGYVRYQTVDTPPEEKAVANRVHAGINIYFGGW